MKIINEIKRIVENELTLPFIYASEYNINEKIARTELPCVAMVRTVSGKLDFKKDVVNVLLFFVDKTENKLTDLENAEIIADQKSTAIYFLREAVKSDVFYIESEINYQDVYNEFDINTTGVSLSFSAKELVGSPICRTDSFTTVFDKTFKPIE